MLTISNYRNDSLRFGCGLNGKACEPVIKLATRFANGHNGILREEASVGIRNLVDRLVKEEGLIHDNVAWYLLKIVENKSLPLYLKRFIKDAIRGGPENEEYYLELKKIKIFYPGLLEYKNPNPKITCPNCGSNKICKNGITSSGVQKYKCKAEKCGKPFQETYVNPFNTAETKTIKNCPNCESDNVYRWGKDNGIQKYKCNKCTSIFRDEYKRDTKTPVKCPKCGEDKVKKNGKNRDLVQQYICQNEDCRNRFLETYKADTKTLKECPNCNKSDNVFKSGIRNGLQRLKCSKCGKCP